jgi:hypothetical protein
MAYIYPAPGVANVQAKLTLIVSGKTGNLVVPALQDVTINNSNDVFTWTQLDEGSKKQIATTATNSLSTNLVLDQDVFFGTAVVANTVVAGSAANLGIFGLSAEKTLVDFELFMGKTSEGDAGKTIKGEGYITGLAPTVSADAPVWVTPVTVTVDGDYTVA